MVIDKETLGSTPRSRSRNVGTRSCRPRTRPSTRIAARRNPTPQAKQAMPGPQHAAAPTKKHRAGAVAPGPPKRVNLKINPPGDSEPLAGAQCHGH